MVSSSHQQHALVPQQPLLPPQPSPVTRQLRPAAAADDAVTGDDDRNRVASVGRADGAHGFGVVDGRGDRAVTCGLAVADAEKLLPDLALKGRAFEGQGQVEAAQRTGEIGSQLTLRLFEERMRARRGCGGLASDCVNGRPVLDIFDRGYGRAGGADFDGADGGVAACDR